MASEVEISAQITGVQSVLSEIEQLREAISNLTTGGAGGMGNVGNSYNAMQPQGDSPQQATAPHPNSGKPRYNPPPVGNAPPASAGRTDGQDDPYESYNHGGDQYTRLRGQHAMAQSFLGYATAPMSDMGSLAHLGNGIQQMTSAFIDAHRLHVEHKRVSEEIARHLKEIKESATTTSSGGVSVQGGTPMADPSAGGSGGGMLSGALGLMSKAAPFAAGAYGVYSAIRGGSRFIDDYRMYAPGGMYERERELDAEQLYQVNYGLREKYGFGTGRLESDFARSMAEHQSRVEEINTRYDNPLFTGGVTKDPMWGFAAQMTKSFAPGIYEANRRAELRSENLSWADMSEEQRLLQTQRELRQLGISDTVSQPRMYQSMMERLGATAQGRNLSGFNMPNDASLNKMGLRQEDVAELVGIATGSILENSSYISRYGSGATPFATGGRFANNRSEALQALAQDMLIQGDPRALAMMRYSGADPTKQQNFLDAGDQLRFNTAQGRMSQAEIGELQGQRMSFRQLGGSREDIYANMSRESVMYDAQIKEAQFQLKLYGQNGNTQMMAETRTRIQGLLRQKAMAEQGTLNYGYQTNEFRNTLTGATAEGEMGVMLNMGASIYDLAGRQDVAEDSIRGNIANLERKIRDPRLAVNAEQRRQWYIEKLNLEKRLQGSRRGFMDTTFGEDMSRVGVSGALAGSDVAFAEMFGGAGARLEAEEGSLEAQGAAVGLLRGRYNDMASGRRPSSQKEINDTLAQLIEAMSKLTMATERSAQNKFDIPIAIAAQRGEIAKTYMSVGIAAGAGGMGIAGDFSQAYSDASQEVAGLDAKVADLRARGHDENDPSLMSAKKAAGQARLNQLSLGSSFAGSPLSASSQNAINQSQFELGILNTLPGAVGSRRNVIGSQINLLSGAVEETMARMDFQRQAQGGVLTNADQLRYNDELRGYKTQQVGLFNEMSYGWQSRLMSTIINAPGNFAGVAPGLAMRAAVGSGVRNPLFGSNGFDIPDFMGGASLMGSISGATGTPVGMAVTGMTRTPGASPATPLYVVNVGGQGNMGTRGVDPYRPGENVKMPTPKHLTDTPH